jgi:spore coat protein A
LSAAVEAPSLELAPAERADLIVDFRDSAGKNVVLQSILFELVQFRVAIAAGPAAKPVPTRLRHVASIDPASAVKTRTLMLAEREQPPTGRMLMLLDGRRGRSL